MNSQLKRPLAAFFILWALLSAACIQDNQKTTDTITKPSSNPPPSFPPQDLYYTGNLSLEIKAPECSSGEFNVSVKLSNVGNTTVAILPPTPFIVLTFKLYAQNGSEMRYKGGPVTTYLPFKNSDLIVLRPGEFYEREIVLNTDYWLAGNGTYKLVAIYDSREIRAEVSVPIWRGKLKEFTWITFGECAQN